ncbi:PcfJ domain-containing protein [Hylemonella gracilis]|uniref:PcfJ domain-containing protein n=1 Tax=Hylemonella gracilis TaxID=80880 RepID=UPI0009E0443C|nr:PcfJ domain-containing protein [Hylemonella gracilis]
MSGALVGFRIGGEKKLLRLHGERGCESVLTGLLAWLRGVSDARLHAYAGVLHAVDMAQGHYTAELREKERAILLAFFEDHLGESCQPPTWAEAFAAFPELEGWHAGFPYMPAANIDACADVPWGFLLDLDADRGAGELQIYINRHARFAWRDMGVGPAAPCCTVPLAHARKLTAADVAALQGLLHQNFYSDGIDPLLPLREPARNHLSPPFPALGSTTSVAGEEAWLARLHLSAGHARLLLERAGLRATVRQVSELRLDDPHCGAWLREALAPEVLALTLAIHGPGASLGQMARVAAHLPSLPFAVELRTEAGAEVVSGGLPLLALGLNPHTGLNLALSPRDGPAYFDALRTCFLDGGMSVQGWRFLIKQDNAVLRAILQFFPPSARILRGFTHFINLLASSLQREPLTLNRCQPALRGVERILDRTRGRPEAMREENARIFLRALMRARLSVEQEANLAHEAQDVSDFVYAHTAVLKGATWASLCRRSDAWHRALLIEVDPAKDLRWHALLPLHQSGAYVAVELDSGYLLAEEGLEQRHCIGSYANACASGGTRVFSLRHGTAQGRRVATLEVQRGHDGVWRMVQIRGKANTPVHDPQLLQAADQVVAAYGAAVRTRAMRAGVSGLGSSAVGDYAAPPYVIHRQEHWTG